MNNRLPHLFKLQVALEVLSQQTDVLPAVGGATEDELHADADELQDQEANSHSTPDIPFNICAYALANSEDKLDLLMGHVSDAWDTMRALVGEIQQKLENPGKDTNWSAVKTWQGLLDGSGLVDTKEGKARGVGEVAPITVNRFRRILRRIVSTRQSGIFVDQLSRNHCDLSEKIREIKGD